MECKNCDDLFCLRRKHNGGCEEVIEDPTPIESSIDEKADTAQALCHLTSRGWTCIKPGPNVMFEYNLIGRNTIEGIDMDALRKAGITFGDKILVYIKKI